MPERNWFEVLGDKHVLQILALLIDGRSRNLYAISRDLGLYPRTVNLHLKRLAKLGLMRTECIGGIKLYRVRRGQLPKQVSIFLRWLSKDIWA